MTADRLAAFIKTIEDRCRALDAVMLKKPAGTTLGYQVGLHLAALKQDIEKAREAA